MRSRVLIVLGALILTLLMPVAVGARSANGAARAEHDRILAYWTPARIAAAQPRDYIRDDKGHLVPYAKPGGGSSGTGASWIGGGAVVNRVGKILYHAGNSNWVCSGTVVTDASTSNHYSVVLSAGHCAYDQADGWSTNWMFIPDFDDAPTFTCSATVYGCWTATRLAINSDFYPSGFGPDAALRVDYSFALVGLGGKPGEAKELDAVVGGYGLKTSGTSNADTQWAFGYPAAGKYHGNDLIYCTGTTTPDPYGVDTWGMACNMTGGSSGGGWLYGSSNPGTDAGKLLSSVNSYGYSGLTKMFGPKFDSETPVVMGDVIDGSATGGVTVLH